MDRLVYDISMIRGKVKAIYAYILAVTASIALPLPVSADACNTKHGTTFDWGCGSNPIIDMFITIFNWASAAVVLAIIGGVVYGAILYSSSGGNKGRAEQGIGVIRNAIIALILYVGMFSIINFLVPGGLFNA